MKVKLIFISILLLVTGVSCAKSSDTNKDGSEKKQDVDGALINGTWKDNCKTSGEGEYKRGGYNLASINGSTLIISGDSFMSSDCTGDKGSSMKMTFSFEIPSRSALGPEIFNFNATPRKVSYVFFDQDSVNASNTIAYCGFTDWAVNVEKEITDKDCMSGPKVGEIIYSIVSLTENKIQFGVPDSGHDGTTADLRHIKLAPESFVKLP